MKQYKFFYIPLIIFSYIVINLFTASYGQENSKEIKKIETETSHSAKKRITLEEAISMALVQNRLIQMALRNEGISQDRIDRAYSAYYPFFEMTTGFRAMNKDPGIKDPDTGRENVSGDRNTFMVNLAAKYLLTDFGGRFFRLSAVKIDKLIAKISTLETTQKITLEVTESYFNLLMADHFYKVAQDSLGLFSKQVNVSKDLFNNQIAPKNDVLTAEIRLSEAEQMLITAENNIAISRALLNFKIGLDIDAHTRIEDIGDMPVMKLDYKRCLLMAIDHRPELKRLKYEKQQANTNIKVAKSEFLPKIVGDVGYAYTSDEYRLNDDYLSAGVFLQWDFIKNGKVPAVVREAKRFLEQMEDRLKMQNDIIVLEVKTSFLRAEENRKKIDVAKKAIRQAEENLNIFQDKYKESMVSITELLVAQNMLTKSRFEYFTARYTYYISLARLENAIGTHIWLTKK